MSEVRTLSEAMLMPLLPNVLRQRDTLTATTLTDLDDITETGYYLINAGGASPAKLPPGLTGTLGGVLIVMKLSSCVLQIFLHGWNPSGLFYRMRWFSTWRSWLQVTTAVAT